MDHRGQFTGERRSFIDRMLAAAKLDPSVFNEVEHDLSATGQAAGVVCMAAVASALGGLEASGINVVVGLVASLLGWLLWAGVTYLVGDKLLGGTASWGELLRTLGFAQAPGVLYVAAALPLIGWLARAVVGVWILFAGIVAIREALDFSTGRAVLTALIGWFFLIILSLLFVIPAAVSG